MSTEVGYNSKLGKQVSILMLQCFLSYQRGLKIRKYLLIHFWLIQDGQKIYVHLSCLNHSQTELISLVFLDLRRSTTKGGNCLFKKFGF